MAKAVEDSREKASASDVHGWVALRNCHSCLLRQRSEASEFTCLAWGTPRVSSEAMKIELGNWRLRNYDTAKKIMPVSSDGCPAWKTKDPVVLEGQLGQ